MVGDIGGISNDTFIEETIGIDFKYKGYDFDYYWYSETVPDPHKDKPWEVIVRKYAN